MTVDLVALGLRSEYAPEGGVGDRRRRQVSHAQDLILVSCVPLGGATSER